MSDEKRASAAAARTGDGTDQANTLVPVPRYHIKGKLYYKRLWDYNTANNTEKFKEYLPSAKIELHLQLRGRATFDKVGAASALSEEGEFEFADVPACVKIGLKIYLDNKNDITRVKGNENLVNKPDYQVKRGQVIWRRIELDIKKIEDAVSAEIDFGDVEIKPTTETDADFASICDTYKTIWRGHNWIREKAGHKLSVCPVNYPVRTISYHSGGELYLLPGDLKDADVVLHEYGHYIGHEMLGGLTHPGYGYNDDAAGQHGPNSDEHYESAWNEGHATFLACAISDDPIYHDGYDSNLTMNLKTDNITRGPHCEGSIQCGLWDMHKAQAIDFKAGFWAAFKRTARKADTIFSFYENWKDAGCPDIAKLKAALTKFNLHIGYTYTRRLKHGTTALDPAAPTEFRTIDELYDAYGKVAGGTLASYREELYNRNQYVGGGLFAGGATLSSFNFVIGTTYIVPERFEIT